MMRPMILRVAHAFRRLAACERGANAVEMAIVLPVLSLMIVGAVYSGWMLYSETMLFFATETAARCAAVNVAVCGGANQVPNTQAYAVTQAAQLGLTMVAANFTVTQPANGCGWRVQATYPFKLVLPFQTNLAVNLTASACYPIM
jgi:Flp pilus assembly protein TadG